MKNANFLKNTFFSLSVFCTAKRIACLAAFACAFSCGVAQNSFPSQGAQQQEAQEIIKENATLPEIEKPTPPLSADFWEEHFFIILISTLAALLLVGFIILRPRKRHIPSPYEIARERLALAGKIFEEFGEKKYAEEVSQLVRDYIEAKHKLPAPERTTEEFLSMLAHSENFDEAQKEKLSQILKLADMAKFAAHAFNESERAAILKNADEFIESDNAKLLENEKNEKKTAKSEIDKESARLEKILKEEEKE